MGFCLWMNGRAISNFKAVLDDIPPMHPSPYFTLKGIRIRQETESTLET